MKTATQHMPLARRANRGFTIVEVMVSLLLTTLLLGGAIQVYLSSKQSFNLQDGLSRVQENGRFALDFLQRGIHIAGFPRSNPTMSVNAIVSALSTDGGGNANDAITVQYQSTLDCGGTDISGEFVAGTTPFARDTYFIQNNSLMCNGLKADNSVRATYLLVQDVENMQVVYGMDTDGDGVANQYFNAANVGLIWPSIVSVRIALLLRSDPSAQSKPATAPTYSLLDAAPYTPASDGRLRKMFTTTIILRNRTSS